MLTVAGARGFARQCYRDPLRTTANTPRMLVATIVGSWLLFGLAFAAVEPDIGWFDGLYLGTVVQSTLGFGDVLPTGVPGKVLVMAYVWFCIYFILPAAIFHVSETLIHNEDEWSHEEQRVLMGDVAHVKRTLAHLSATLVDNGRTERM